MFIESDDDFVRAVDDMGSSERLWFGRDRAPHQDDQHPLATPLSEPLLVAFLDYLENSNLSITGVTIRSCFLQRIPNIDLVTRFFLVVGGIPTLISAKWETTVPGASASMQNLTCFLTSARGLLLLTCTKVSFSGTQQEFQGLANAFQEHPRMSQLHFQQCTIDQQNRVPDCRDPVLRAFRTMPRLFWLVPSCWALSALAQGTSDTADAMVDLFQHPKLYGISLTDVSLAKCPRPAWLTIQNSQRLRSLQVKATPEETECLMLADLVKENNSLVSLDFCGTDLDSNNDQHLEHVLKALQNNSTIQRTHFSSNYMPSKNIQKVLVESVRGNTTLTSIGFGLDSAPPSGNENAGFWTETQFYLSLNRMGRKRVLGKIAARTNTWIEVLAQAANEDLSAVNYFLSLNPALCGHYGQAKRSATTISSHGAVDTEEPQPKRAKVTDSVEGN